MVKRRQLRHRTPAPKPVEEEPEELEEELEEATEEELEEELEEEDEDDDDDDTPPEPRKARRVEQTPAPVRHKIVTKPAPVPAKVAPAPVQIPKVKTVEYDAFFDAVFEHLDIGKTLMLSVVGNGKLQVSLSDKVATAPAKLKGKAYWDSVKNPDYEEWMTEWHKKTYEQKKAYAKKIGAKWSEHKDPRVDVMKITEAVREKEGIQKYREGFETRAARAAIR